MTNHAELTGATTAWHSSAMSGLRRCRVQIAGSGNAARAKVAATFAPVCGHSPAALVMGDGTSF
jgi:hypothetical protein